MGAAFHLTQRVNAYQPRVQPWQNAAFHLTQRVNAYQLSVQPWESAGFRLTQRVNAYQPRVQPWDSARLHLPQRGNAYQPRVQPWGIGRWVCSRDADGGYGCALKERRIVRVRVSARVGDATIRGVSLKCGNVRGLIPRALPWAGMRCPVGAGVARAPCCR